MQIYLINLARRPDRLAAMTGQAVALGLALERVEAQDAESAQGLERWFAPAGPLGEIPRGDKACRLCHRRGLVPPIYATNGRSPPR